VASTGVVTVAGGEFYSGLLPVAAITKTRLVTSVRVCVCACVVWKM